jgi:hypothetical protein
MTITEIATLLNEKHQTREVIISNARAQFDSFKERVIEFVTEINKQPNMQDFLVYKLNGDFELQLIFCGEVLIFSLHTDMFMFDDSHFVHNLMYVKDDRSRSYCAIIKVYNFLHDSFKFNRLYDVGYLIGRVFINKDNHYFVEGKRQLGFLYNDFENAEFNSVNQTRLIESCLLYAMEFDLLVPPFDEVKEIPLGLKLEQHGNAAIKTGKRLGFRFNADTDVTD